MPDEPIHTAPDERATEATPPPEERLSLVPTRGSATTPDGTPLPSGVPAQIGPYRVLGILGRGGMGVVLECEQEQPLQRRVAVKLIRHGLASEELVARFGSERQVLARMGHPAIARVFDAGSTEDGRPYFAMEVVDGEHHPEPELDRACWATLIGDRAGAPRFLRSAVDHGLASERQVLSSEVGALRGDAAFADALDQLRRRMALK